MAILAHDFYWSDRCLAEATTKLNSVVAFPVVFSGVAPSGVPPPDGSIIIEDFLMFGRFSLGLYLRDGLGLYAFGSSPHCGRGGSPLTGVAYGRQRQTVWDFGPRDD